MLVQSQPTQEYRRVRNDPDRQLVSDIRAGAVKRPEWEQYVARLRKEICARYPCLSHVADEIADETAITAFDCIQSYRGSAGFFYWTLGIGRHIAGKYLRMPRDVSLEIYHGSERDAVAESELDRVDLQLTVQSSLNCLTDLERKVFMARVMDDTDHRDIAHRLAISPNASRQTWTRAIAKMRSKSR